MSYDLALSVRVAGCENVYAVIARPEYDHPTYNLGKMFRACMDWDYKQSEQDEDGNWKTVYYPCDEVIKYVERGIKELHFNRKKYEQYNPQNGWGSIESAIRSLESLRDCIYEQAQGIPIGCLWMSW